MTAFLRQRRAVRPWAVAWVVSCLAAAAATADDEVPLFQALTASPAPRLIAYTPSQLDPRQEVNQRRLATSSIRADLEALRPAFDGLVLYGYHEACTPRVVALARELKFRVLILSVWDPKSAAELDGVVDLALRSEKDLACGVLIGNEGITFKRYEPEDLALAARRVRERLPERIPISTSEPLVGYGSEFVRGFGDFVCPNIHPVFDRAELGPAAGAAWAREQAGELALQIKKPVVLKETGFPHHGKDAYTPDAQRAFWAAYVQPGLVVRPKEAAGAWVYHGVAFEAFDLPWKSEESKLAIEKSWGLLGQDRRPYPAFEVWRALGKARP